MEKFAWGSANDSPYEVGTRIEIIDAGFGAGGANGKTGEIVGDGVIHNHGLCLGDPGYKVRLDNGEVWKISTRATVNVVDKEGE